MNKIWNAISTISFYVALAFIVLIFLIGLSFCQHHHLWIIQVLAGSITVFAAPPIISGIARDIRNKLSNKS